MKDTILSLKDILYLNNRFKNFYGREYIPKNRNSNIFDHLQYVLLEELNDPLRRKVTDIEHVKSYISKIVGKKYVVPTYAILRSKKEIEEYNFPDKCFCKYNDHIRDYFIKQKNQIDVKKIQSWFDYPSYFSHTKESNYYNLPKKVMVEKIINDPFHQIDYKFWCMNGHTKLIQLDFFILLSRSLKNNITWSSKNFDIYWNELNFKLDARNYYKPKIKKPIYLKSMLEVASELSKKIKGICRVDFFVTKDQFYVGEITNYPMGGLISLKEKNKFNNLFFIG